MKKIAAVLIALLALTACEDVSKPSGVARDKAVSDNQLQRYSIAQPVPEFPYSQLRQNLIEIETAQANATQTTSFFFNQGVVDPIMVCPSIGYAIPATYSLTNPEQVVSYGTNVGVTTIQQIEQTGVYTGPTSGTHVICVGADGKGFDSYWEGFVQTVSGPAEWDNTTKRVKMLGPSSFDFSTKKK